jgi:hypothetical protein
VDFGRIERDSGDIGLAEWLQVITEHPFLEHMSDREGINPFTNERVVFSGQGKAFYVAGGERLGNAGLAEGQILTTGIPRDVCEEIAKLLCGRVFEDDRS